MTSEEAEKHEELLSSIYKALNNSGLSYELCMGVLHGHMQRLICDKAEKDKAKIVELTEKANKQFQYRINRYIEVFIDKNAGPPNAPGY